MITITGLRKVFRQESTGQVVVAIDRLDLEVPRGEIVAIVGRTGCGKSTLLNLLLGLDRPTEGSIVVDGRTPHADFAAFRGRIAAIFQEDRLLPWRTALANATLGLELVGRIDQGSKERAVDWLRQLGLAGHLRAFPGELSGGMRQRVALARALAVEPEVLLADEAFGHLDEVTAAALRQSFVDLVRSQGITTILVTHQIEEAIETGDRILVFGIPGRVLADIRTPLRADRYELRSAIQRMIDANSVTCNSTIPAHA